MARRPRPTKSNRQFAAERIQQAAGELLATYAAALEPVRRLATGPCAAEDVVDAVAALRQAQAHSRDCERRLLAMAVLRGAHIGTMAKRLGIARTTLSGLVNGAGAELRGRRLARSPDGTWRLA